jgi:hypothetical protein
MALIEQALVVERILRHLGLPTGRPEPRPPRALPLDDEGPYQSRSPDGRDVLMAVLGFVSPPVA